MLHSQREPFVGPGVAFLWALGGVGRMSYSLQCWSPLKELEQKGLSTRKVLVGLIVQLKSRGLTDHLTWMSQHHFLAEAADHVFQETCHVMQKRGVLIPAVLLVWL